jgi:tetratricopeptide (TPR) repeat protein
VRLLAFAAALAVPALAAADDAPPAAGSDSRPAILDSGSGAGASATGDARHTAPAAVEWPKPRVVADAEPATTGSAPLGDAEIARLVAEAAAAVRDNRPGDALTAVERVLASNPAHLAARFIRASVLATTGEVAAAEAGYRSLIAEHPELPEPHNNLAVLLAGRGQLDEARRELETAVAVEPTYAIALENLGDVHAMLALAAYRRAAGVRTARGLQAKLAQAQALTAEIRESPSPAPSGLEPTPATRRDP